MNQLTTTAEATRTNLELAKAFADSKLVPDHFKKSVGDCYIAIKLADHYGMEPWMLMQELYLIQGKPMMSGKMAIAILNHSLADPLRPTYSGEGDEREIVLVGRPQGEPGPLDVKLKVKDAKTANEQWKKNPDQMLMYSAARMWGRRYTPDILLGIVFDDEDVDDAPPIVPQRPTTTIAEPQPRTGGPEVIDESTGEILDHPVTLAKHEQERWYDWGARLVAGIRSSQDIPTVDKWLAANADTLKVCREEAAKIAGNIDNAVKLLKSNLMAAEA